MTDLYYPPIPGPSAIVKSRTVSGAEVPSHDVEQLPTAFTTDTAAIKTAVQALAALISASRLDVGLSTTVQTYLSKLDTIAANQAPPSAIYGGKQTVTTAGTRVQLQAASQVLTEGVWVRGLDANAGVVYPGNSSVTSTAAGTRLAAKEAIFIRIDNLNKVYIDASTNGDGVSFLGW